jgi:hypothetical protein
MPDHQTFELRKIKHTQSRCICSVRRALRDDAAHPGWARVALQTRVHWFAGRYGIATQQTAEDYFTQAEAFMVEGTTARNARDAVSLPRYFRIKLPPARS